MKNYSKQIAILSAIILLLTLVAFMAKDLFFDKPNDANPYAFDLKSIRSGDTAKAAYTETSQIKVTMEEIHGIDVDARGLIFVAGKDTVVEYSSSGKRENSFYTGGTALCISTDDQDNLYLGMQDHIEIWKANGKIQAKWNTCGEDAVITSIAVRGNDVFAADAGQKVVLHFDLKGNLVNKIGLKDPATGVPGFIIPSPYFDLAISKDGYLWVVNTGRHSFEKFRFDGTLVSSWGKASMAMDGFCGCCNPSNFAFIYDSLFVTSEKAIERVKVYNHDGSFRCIVATPEQFEEGTKGLDLAVDKQNRIMVLDPVKKLVRTFEPAK